MHSNQPNAASPPLPHSKPTGHQLRQPFGHDRSTAQCCCYAMSADCQSTSETALAWAIGLGAYAALTVVVGAVWMAVSVPLPCCDGPPRACPLQTRVLRDSAGWCGRRLPIDDRWRPTQANDDGEPLATGLGPDSVVLPPDTLQLPSRGWRIQQRELKSQRLVARGIAFDVYDGVFRGHRVTIRKVQPHSMRNRRVLKSLRDESYLLASLNHPNILVFHGAVDDRSAHAFSIVSEHCPNGSLHRLLQSPVRLSWSRRLQFAVDVARGLIFLHHRGGVVMKSMSTSSLMLDDYYRVKLSTYGLGLSGELAQSTEAAAMSGFCAPEVLRGEACTEQADGYSLGMVLWELLTRQVPFRGVDKDAIASRVVDEGVRPPIPVYCPAEWAALMRGLWQADPDKRPTIDHVLTELLRMLRSCDDTVNHTVGVAGERSAPPPWSSGSTRLRRGPRRREVATAFRGDSQGMLMDSD
jgi:serine/threonine protein kinase